MREKVSACIMTLNEEANIERCLRSVTWCDEIVILDSGSTDRTLEICRTFTDNIHQHPWQGYIGQRNHIRGLAAHDWVLFMDADEEISPELRRDLLAEIEHGLTGYVGYVFPRRVHYLGRWIRWGEWNPDLKLRFFKKDRGHSVGEEPHDRVVVDGPVKRLSSPLYHYTYDDLADHIETMNRFSSLSAKAKFEGGYRFRRIDFLFRPAFRFWKGYFLKLGFLDGRRGFLIALISSWGVAIKYAKVWELQIGHRM
jgi:glycosyltransferase involved in cell wall biosynthesis